MGHNMDPAVGFYVVLFCGFLDFGKEAVECDFTIKSPVWPHFTSITFKCVGSCCRDSQQTRHPADFCSGGKNRYSKFRGLQSPNWSEIKMAAWTLPPTVRKPGEEQWRQILSSSDSSVNHDAAANPNQPDQQRPPEERLQRQQAFLFIFFVSTCDHP